MKQCSEETVEFCADRGRCCCCLVRAFHVDGVGANAFQMCGLQPSKRACSFQRLAAVERKGHSERGEDTGRDREEEDIRQRRAATDCYSVLNTLTILSIGSFLSGLQCVLCSPILSVNYSGSLLALSDICTVPAEERRCRRSSVSKCGLRSSGSSMSTE